jgi:membrane-bound lytic murein transglycosylase D
VPNLLAVPGTQASEAAQAAFVHSSPRGVKPFPIILNDSVQEYVDQMLEHPAGLTESFERSRPYMPEMMKVMEGEGLPKDLVYLSFAESGFSRDGAGPWQLSKATARRFGLVVNNFIDERRDPVMSTKAAAEYLLTLHDETDDWKLTVVGWNRGEGALDRFWSLRGVDYENLIDKVPSSTRSLLNRFMAVAVIAHNAREYGLQAVTFVTNQPFYRRIQVKGGTPLKAVAERYNTSTSRLRELNPALLRDSVPPRIPYLTLRVPNPQNASLAHENNNS